MMQVRSWISEHKDSMVETAMELIKIRSVSESGTEAQPYGAGCALVLDKALAIGRDMGFVTENHEYHCGSILLPGETEDEIGIFVHLDVVHEGEGWNTDPYMPIVKEGWLYGRGSADNKGPASAVLYSMKYIKEQGITLRHTIRLYLGCSEERGMEDINYYINHHKVPVFSFIPDAAFPVCYGEKGIMEGEFSCELPGEHLVELTAGVASNAVPAAAKAVLKDVSCMKLLKHLKESPYKNTVDIKEEGSKLIMEVTGKSAHAAFPEGSESASVKLCRILSEINMLSEAEQKMVQFMDCGFASYYGDGMGIAFEDEQSGKLTLIGGMTGTSKGRVIQNFNIRYPVSAKAVWIRERLKMSAGRYRWRVDWTKDNPPCIMDHQGEPVRMLVEICRRVLGAEMEPYTMGGGTYARKLPNAVAFGPGIRGQKKPCPQGHGGGHQPDECVNLNNLTNAMEIYIEALIQLDCFFL